MRCATPDELRALDDLHRRSSFFWEEDRAMLERHPEVLGVDPQAIAQARVRVATGAAGELLGFSSTAPRADRASELEALFVEPDLIGRGIGRALVEDAKARAREAGHLRMTVVVAARTVTFYERCGFVVGRPTRTRFAPALRMWCELVGPPDA